MACNGDSYTVRVNKAPPDPYPGLYIYSPNTSGAPSLVTEFRYSGTRVLCFSEDASSSIKGLHIALENGGCPTKSNGPTWEGETMSISVAAPSIGSSSGPLLLKAQEAASGQWHSALSNPNVDGGRPIIRNQFGSVLVYVAIALVAFGVIYMFAKWWKNSHPTPP